MPSNTLLPSRHQQLRYLSEFTRVKIKRIYFPFYFLMKNQMEEVDEFPGRVHPQLRCRKGYFSILILFVLLYKQVLC
jgi:hypothetical protein